MLFFNVKSPSEVREILARPTPPPRCETVALDAALRRVLAADVTAPEDLPEFDRSVVDGFAVRAADTFGASPGLPAFLEVAGEVLMGQPASVSVAPGRCVRIATGGMLPPGADAVVMVEHTEAVDERLIEVTRPIAPGENVVRRGDDVREGETVLPAGHRLRASDLGALAGLGILEVAVAARPRVALIPTGDEVVDLRERPGPGQIRDINTTALAAAVREAGGEPRSAPIVRDDPDLLKATVARALAETDLVLISGGSSVGARDWTLEVLLSFPRSELLVHGVAIRPGKPVIVVRVGESWLIGLPGNPVSALVVYEQFVRPLQRRLEGDSRLLPSAGRVTARLATNLSSDPGKEDYVRVRVRRSDAGLVAEPVLGKSALVMTLVQADGLVVIPESAEGIEAGEPVAVELY
jgi:molybdopterin molybdotransferase